VQSGDKLASGFRAAASAAESFARTGKLSGEAAKSALTGVAGSLAMFLPGGAFTAGIGIATLAIVQGLSRVKQEAREAAEETKKSLDQLQNAGDVSGLTKRAQVIRQGTPAAEFKDGLDAMERDISSFERRIREKNAEIAEATAQRNVGLFNALTGELTKLEGQLEAVSRKAKPIQSEFAQILVRVQAPGPKPIREGVLAGVKVTAADPAKAAADTARKAEESARALRDFNQAASDLFAKAQLGTVTLSDFDRTVRELSDSFGDRLKNPTQEQTTAFSAFTEEAAKVRDTIVTIKADQAVETFNKLFASMTTTAVDDLQVGLEELRQQFAKGLLPKEREAELIGATASFIEATFAVEQAGKAIEDARFRGIEYGETLIQIDDLQKRLNETAGRNGRRREA
jgi:hypothetical protein